MELRDALDKLKISESTFHRRLRRLGITDGSRIVDGHLTPAAARALGLRASPRQRATTLRPATPVRPSPPSPRELATVREKGVGGDEVHSPRPHIPPSPIPTVPTVVPSQTSSFARVQARDVEGLQSLLQEYEAKIEEQQAELRRLTDYIEQADTLLGAMAQTIGTQDQRLIRLEAGDCHNRQRRDSGPLSGIMRLFDRQRSIPTPVNTDRIGPPPLVFFANTLSRF